MIITHKQLLVLYQIAVESCKTHGSFAGYTADMRLQLVNQILDQQSDEPVEQRRPAMGRFSICPWCGDEVNIKTHGLGCPNPQDPPTAEGKRLLAFMEILYSDDDTWNKWLNDSEAEPSDG